MPRIKRDFFIFAVVIVDNSGDVVGGEGESEAFSGSRQDVIASHRQLPGDRHAVRVAFDGCIVIC
ncbi:MAG: hypothetical protein L3J71_03560 [Victivallaceae bacterium]|nr:hypothetical protein [Victivallaceae bacterium]